MLGRRGPAQAAFTVPELIGLAGAPGSTSSSTPAAPTIPDDTTKGQAARRAGGPHRSTPRCRRSCSASSPRRCGSWARTASPGSRWCATASSPTPSGVPRPVATGDDRDPRVRPGRARGRLPRTSPWPTCPTTPRPAPCPTTAAGSPRACTSPAGSSAARPASSAPTRPAPRRPSSGSSTTSTPAGPSRSAPASPSRRWWRGRQPDVVDLDGLARHRRRGAPPRRRPRPDPGQDRRRRRDAPRGGPTHWRVPASSARRAAVTLR